MSSLVSSSGYLASSRLVSSGQISEPSSNLSESQAAEPQTFQQRLLKKLFCLLVMSWALGFGAMQVWAQAPTAAPTLNAPTLASQQVGLSWNTVANATSYRVYRSTASGTLGSLAHSPTSTSQNATGLTNGSTYYFTVRAANSSGEGPSSAQKMAIPMAAPVAYIFAGGEQMVLNWSTVAGATSYSIYRGASAASLTLLVNNLSASTTTYIDNGLIAGSTYYYRLVANNSTGSTNSSVVNATVMSAPVVTTATENTQIALSWPAVSGATQYEVRRGAAFDTATVLSTNVPSRTYTDSGLTTGNSYTYYVVARNTNGFAYTVTPALAATPPVLSSVLGSGGATLNWTSAAGVTQYYVYRGTSPVDQSSFTLISGALSSNTLTYTDIGLTNGNAYYYAIFGATSGASYVYSNVLEVKPIAKPTLNIGSGSDVYLWWNATAGATQYDVYRGISATDYPNYTKIASDLSIWNYTSTGLTPGDTYYYRLGVKNSSGSIFSDTVSAVPLVPPMLIPTVGNGQVTFSWAPAAGATSYEVRRGSTYETATILQTNITNRTFTETGLTNGTRYTYYIVSRNATGFAYLAVGVIPSASPLLRAVGGAGQVALNWDAVSGATGYDVYRGTSATDASTFAPIATNQTGLSYTDSTAVNGTTYYYGLVIYDAGGVIFSNLASATPRALPVTPTGLSASAGNAQVTLNWTSAGDADSYKLYRSTTPTGTTTEITVPGGGTTNSYLDTGRTNGTTYYYTLKAFNTTGSSAASSQVNAKPVAPPSALTLTGGAPSGAIALSWNSVSGVTYTLKRGTDSGGPYSTTVATGLTATTYTDSSAVAGTSYYYVVTATNAGGTSPNSNQIAAKALETPTLSLTGIGGGTASLEWTAVTGASHYEVFRSQNSSNFGSTAYATVAAPTLTYTDSSASNGQTYYYKVRATAPAVNSSTGVLSAYVTATPVAAPVVSASVGAGQVTLTWAGVTGASSYQVYESTSSGVQGSLITASSGTPRSGLNNGTTYYYQVRAVNATGSGPFSAQVSATPRALPAQPIGLSAVAGNAKVTLSWTTATDADSYKLYRSTTPTGTTTEITVLGGTSANSYLDSGRTNGTTLYYTLKAFNSSGNSVDSDQVSATPTAPPASAPTLSLSTGDASANLSWTTVSGAAHYRIKRATVAGGPYTTLSNMVTGTSFADSGLVNSTTYYYRVYAANLGGDGPDSSEKSGTPLALPAKVGAVTLTAGDSQIGLSFAAVATASEYRVYRATTAGGYDFNAAPTLTLTGTGTISGTDTGLSNGVTYYYVVKAVNSTGVGAASDEVSTTTLAKPGKSVLSAVAGDDKVDLSWTAVSGASFYTLKRGTATGGPYGTTVAANIASTLTAYEDSDVTNGTTYYYVLAASNASGVGLASDEKSAKPQAAPATAPGNLSVTSDGLQVSLSWDAVTDADGYKIYRTTTLDTQENPVFGTEVLATTATTSYEDNDVEHGVTYYYQVRAYNGTGQGPAAEGEITVYAHLGLDARIASGSVNDWVGEDIINTTGLNQTISASPAAGQTVKYRVQVNTTGGNSGNKSMYVTIPDWETNEVDGWTIHVFNNHSGGTDVTDLVFGTNPTTNAKGWLATVPNGQPLKLRIELTAPSTANVDDAKSLKVKIAENSTKEVIASDTVKATAQVRATTQPDLSARPIVTEGDDAAWTGDGVIGGTTQTVSVVAIAGTSRSYELRIKNAGTAPNSFVLRMQAAQTGWTDKLFNSLTGTTEITTEARETTGWVTPELAAGATLSLRLEVSGSVNAAANYNTDFEVSSGIETDQVTIEQLQQNITGLQWSTDGDTWTAVDAQTSLVMNRFATLGFRATKALSNEEWGENILGPSWTFHGKDYEDGEIWVAAEHATPTTSENVQVTYGGHVYANIPVKVLHDCSLSLTADRYYVVPGTAGGYSTPLALTLTATDEDDAPLANQQVRFKVTNAQGTAINGKWGETAASEFTGTTDANGQIQINWQGQGIIDPVNMSVAALNSLEQTFGGTDSIEIQVGK